MHTAYVLTCCYEKCSNGVGYVDVVTYHRFFLCERFRRAEKSLHLFGSRAKHLVYDSFRQEAIRNHSNTSSIGNIILGYFFVCGTIPLNHIVDWRYVEFFFKHIDKMHNCMPRTSCSHVLTRSIAR